MNYINVDNIFIVYIILYEFVLKFVLSDGDFFFKMKFKKINMFSIF